MLLKEPGADFSDQIKEMEWSRFPLLEMAKRNWIPRLDDIREKAEELIRDFIEQAGGLVQFLNHVSVKEKEAGIILRWTYLPLPPGVFACSLLPEKIL